MKKVTLALFVIAVAVFTACNQGGKKESKSNDEKKAIAKEQPSAPQGLSGDYVCTEHWNKDLIGKIKISFDKDSVDFPGIAKTTYRIKGDSLFIDMHRYEMGFIIDGNTLTTSGPAGKVSYQKK